MKKRKKKLSRLGLQFTADETIFLQLKRYGTQVADCLIADG